MGARLQVQQIAGDRIVLGPAYSVPLSPIADSASSALGKMLSLPSQRDQPQNRGKRAFVTERFSPRPDRLGAAGRQCRVQPDLRVRFDSVIKAADLFTVLLEGR
ncbi:hypothetical protein XI06_17765 [Bradyrhizobium sp. CCBAU 11434]|nr:hypothetical protein [Bradyrhizobium sp. CCBAU 11434]